MAATFTPIASITLGATTGTITFSALPSTYTDLILISNARSDRAANAGDSMAVRFNADSGSNYSTTILEGGGSVAESTRLTNSTYAYIRIPAATATANVFSPSNLNIMNYTNSTTYKTTIVRSASVSESIGLNVSLWRSTAAITSITLLPANGSFVAGSTFNLYGILGANA